ncbi:hypothetical protein [uncultured Nocardioides sp.]|uniref:hypothetical protein n=1 Tax=uncultured Nocardioides sp. TaxID=198441 RepID=UPI0025FC97FF|nr:hypothetical protein [uncultured Nocardioides sp.]
MSKERARRREEREREAAVRAAARAAVEERRARTAARRERLTSLRPGRPSGRPTGTLARRRQQQTTMLGCGLLVVNLLVWFAWSDVALQVLSAMVTVLAAPVLHTLLFPRPR